MPLKHRNKMPELKEVFSGLLVKGYNMTEAEVSSLFSEDGNPKDDAIETILSRQATSLQKMRDKAKEERDQAFARGVREKAEEVEKALKDAGVEIGDAKGADAVKKLIEHIEARTKPSDLDDDKVKNSAFFRKREKELLDQISAKETEFKKAWSDRDAKVKNSAFFRKREKELLDQISAKETEFKKAWSDRDAKEQRERDLSSVKGKRDDLVKTMKPILPEDPEKARRQLSVIDHAIDAHTYEKEGDTWYVINKEGKRLETSNGLPMTVEQFLEAEIKATYELPVSDKKGAAGDITKGTENKGAIKLQKPANRQALAAQIHEISENTTLSSKEKVEMVNQLKEMAQDLA